MSVCGATRVVGKSVSPSYLQNVHLQLAAFGWLAFAAYFDASEVS